MTTKPSRHERTYGKRANKTTRITRMKVQIAKREARYGEANQR